MFQAGDIVILQKTSFFWVIIEKNLPRKVDNNEYMWRMRRKIKNNVRIPELMVAWSSELILASRPCIFPGQELFFRNCIVRIVKDTGSRVQCKIIGMVNYYSFGLWTSNLIIGQQLEILKTALVEANVSIFIRNG